MDRSEKQIVQLLSELAEANRILAGIETLVSRKKPSCWMITSAAWGEGKTTLTAGLAILAARRSDKRVLAIDMNWYSPSLHRSFGLVPEWDKKRYFQDNNMVDLIRPSGMANLDLLTAPVSSANGEEISCAENSGVAQDFLRQARDAYDIILVDAAAIFPVNRSMTDPVVLGSACDLVILVVLSGVTSREQVKRAQMKLESSGTRVAAVVVNHWKNPQ